MNDEHSARHLETPLPDGVVELVDATGETRRFEGENLLVVCAGHYSGMKPIRAGEPGNASLLSHEPGYLVRTESIEVALTLDEFIHLALNALNPDQYRQLHEACGTFGFIGPDYYDPATGKALQPKVRIAG